MISKDKEYILNDDVYFCEVVGNKIIVNNNYSGISIYNYDLKLEISYNLFNDLIIEQPFINYEENKIILFCRDNKRFIFIDLNDYKVKIISISFNIEEVFFTNVYEWNENEIILSSYNNMFFKIELNNGYVFIENIYEIKENYKSFYMIYKLFLEYLRKKFIVVDILKINKNYRLVVFDNKSFIKVIDYNNSIIEKIRVDLNSNFYEIKYDNKAIAFINENIVQLFYENKKEILTLTMEYIYQKIRFLKNSNNKSIISLITDKENEKNSKLVKYNLL